MDLMVGGDTNEYDAFGCGKDASSGIPFMETETAVSIDAGADYNLTTVIYNFTKDQLTQTQSQSTTYQPPASGSAPPPQMTTASKTGKAA